MKRTLDHIYFASPSWLQDWLVLTYGYRLYRKRYAGIYQEIRTLVSESRSWTPEFIEQFQAEKLHEMVRHCRRCIPYYQKLLADYGLNENDFTRTDDLKKIPILDKNTVKTRWREFQKPDSRPYAVQYTSGSTGSPLALNVNEYTYKLAMALLVDHEEYHGVPFGAPRATFAGRMVQTSNDMRPPFARLNRSENQMIFSSYHINNVTFQWYADALKEFSPCELIGYPSAICDLASRYLKAGLNPDFKPTAIVTNSETLLAWQRKIIEQVFQCPVWDYYGTAEYVLFAGQEFDGSYRVNPILGITECWPDTEHEKIGRLIATTLTNTYMPLIRYDTGDIAEKKTSGVTSSTTLTLNSVTGRVDDYIKAPDGRKIGRIDHIFKGLQEILEAQVIQDHSKHCTIKIVSKNNEFHEEEQLKRNFLSRTGGAINVTIVNVSRIDRDANGKFKSVIRLQ